MGEMGSKHGWARRFPSLSTSLARGARRPGSSSGSSPASRKPAFLVDIVISSGTELKDRLIEQGLSPDEVILKYCWPRYAPPADAGIRAMAKSENLGAQFSRLITMHREAPAAFPMPVGTVRSINGEFAGYVLEYVPGDTLQELISSRMLSEAKRQLGNVELVIARLHAKSMPHGDINPSNIIAADDGRTLLIDPVANPRAGTILQDELCVAGIRRQIEDASSMPLNDG